MKLKFGRNIAPGPKEKNIKKIDYRELTKQLMSRVGTLEEELRTKDLEIERLVLALHDKTKNFEEGEPS